MVYQVRQSHIDYIGVVCDYKYVFDLQNMNSYNELMEILNVISCIWILSEIYGIVWWLLVVMLVDIEYLCVWRVAELAVGHVYWNGVYWSTYTDSDFCFWRWIVHSGVSLYKWMDICVRYWYNNLWVTNSQ